jgi:hypothetical protein
MAVKMLAHLIPSWITGLVNICGTYEKFNEVFEFVLNGSKVYAPGSAYKRMRKQKVYDIHT